MAHLHRLQLVFGLDSNCLSSNKLCRVYSSDLYRVFLPVVFRPLIQFQWSQPKHTLARCKHQPNIGCDNWTSGAQARSTVCTHRVCPGHTRRLSFRKHRLSFMINWQWPISTIYPKNEHHRVMIVHVLRSADSNHPTLWHCGSAFLCISTACRHQVCIATIMIIDDRRCIQAQYCSKDHSAKHLS